MTFLINDQSSTISDLPNTNITLWKHQKMMVQKCLDIETKCTCTVDISPTNEERYKEKENLRKKAYLGIMNDPPGTGKTLVMLSLIAMSKSTNILVVPPNLQHEWIKAINTYFKKDTFKFYNISSYSDTVAIWKSNKIFEDIQLIITNTFFIDPLTSALASLKKDINIETQIERVIIDEVDTATNLFYNIPECNKLWLLSASFDVERHTSIGPFKIKKDNIEHCICKCTPEIINCTIVLEEPIEKTF